MLSVDQLIVEFGSFRLFDHISFQINPQDKIGLTGKNGAGKSTLLKLFTGEIKPTKGQVTVPSDITLGYLPQHMDISDDTTVFEEARKAYREILTLQKQIDELNQEIANREDYESESYMKLIHKVTESNERLDLLGVSDMEGAIETTLSGLGFKPEDFQRPTSEFSGGWRMRIELAKILLRKPDVLLLDEPTNHLDIAAIQWFEDFLKDFPGAVVLISHDRAFLDAITNRTVEISLGKIQDYPMPYSKYVEERKMRREQQIAAYENQQKMIEETEEFIERFRYKATKAVQVQSRIKQLEKLDRIEIEEEDTKRMRIKFPPAPRSGDIVVKAKNISKAYGEHQVLQNLDLYLERGEKIAFVGRNGEGKTTLSRIITGELEHQGELKIGHQVEIGYYAQNQEESLYPEKTVFQTIDDIAVGDVRTKIRDILGAFLFSGEDIDKKVKVLSGGEKARLALATLLLKPYNLLVLDEPTNHLDMRSKEILKDALLNYDGSLILVSHDREFLHGLVGKIYEFKNKGIREFIGDIYDFVKRFKILEKKRIQQKKNQSKDKKGKENTSANKENYLKKKEWDKKVRKVEKKITRAEEEITQMEEKLAEKEKLLGSGEANPEDHDFYNEYENLKAEINKKMHEWDELQIQLEEMKEEGF